MRKLKVLMSEKIVSDPSVDTSTHWDQRTCKSSVTPYEVEHKTRHLGRSRPRREILVLVARRPLVPTQPLPVWGLPVPWRSGELVSAAFCVFLPRTALIPALLLVYDYHLCCWHTHVSALDGRSSLNEELIQTVIIHCHSLRSSSCSGRGVFVLRFLCKRMFLAQTPNAAIHFD